MDIDTMNETLKERKLKIEGSKNPGAKRRAELQKLYAPQISKLTTPLFSLVVIAILVFGWSSNLEDYINPESGLGYALGIAGGSLILTLLLYSLRKRARWMKKAGPVKYWFKAHMKLGVLGPVLILYHCGFNLGSTNSNIALFSMLIVAASGLTGRFLYGKIHYGLYGNRVTWAQLRKDESFMKSGMDTVFNFAPKIRGRIFGYEKKIMRPSSNLIHSFWKFLVVGLITRKSYISSAALLDRACADLGRQVGWSAKERRKRKTQMKRYLAAYYGTIKKIVQLSFYEKLFSLWHVLHLPLFYMLIVTGIFHVIAVHMY